jgi:hypothetical protein
LHDKPTSAHIHPTLRHMVSSIRLGSHNGLAGRHPDLAVSRVPFQRAKSQIAISKTKNLSSMSGLI